jgi:hypothetical protein
VSFAFESQSIDVSGQYDRPSTATATVSDNSYYKPSTVDFINLFYRELSRWQSETYYASDAQTLVGHSAFKTIS